MKIGFGLFVLSVGLAGVASGQGAVGEVPQTPPQNPAPAIPPGIGPVPSVTPERVPMISATGRTPSQVDTASKTGTPTANGAPAIPDPSQMAKLPYQELIRIAKSDASQPKDAQVYILKIASAIEGVKPSDIKLTLKLPDVDLNLPVSEEGFFQVPYSIDYYEANPLLEANQPKGSLQISVSLELPKVKAPKVVEGKVMYQELFRPVIEMSEAMAKVDKGFGKDGQQQFALEIQTGGDPVVVKRAISTRTLRPNDKGMVYMILERLLFDENPEVLVPDQTTVNVRPVTPNEAAWIRAQ